MNREFAVPHPENYAAAGLDGVRTPRPIFYYDKILANREKVLSETGGPDGLRLMAKTVKSPEILALYVEVGLRRFKASSLREAERAVIPAGGRDILISYPLLGPYVREFFELCERFPDVQLSALVSNRTNAVALSQEAQSRGRQVPVYLDINPHMHRTGVGFGKPLMDFAVAVQALPCLHIKGLHAYDGHIHHENVWALRLYAQDLIRLLGDTVEQLRQKGIDICEVVTSSSLTFAPTSAAYRRAGQKYDWLHTVSPGTCVLWDSSYNDVQPGHFVYAMAIAARVIDLVERDGAHVLTTDAGVKMGLSPDAGPAHVTTLDGYAPFGGSERHGTFAWLGHDRAAWTPIDLSSRKTVGDVVLLFPRHVCTTLNQYEYGHMVRDGRIAEEIHIAGRDG